MPLYVYILQCSDGSYYTGMTENLLHRLSQHESGDDPHSYTHSRSPVKLVWSQEFPSHEEAFACERQIKGWNRKKKEALIRNDLQAVHQIVEAERRKRRAAKST